MRAPPSFFGYQIFAALVPRELCLQLRGCDDPAAALPACVVGGSSLLSLCCAFTRCQLALCWGLANGSQCRGDFHLCIYMSMVVLACYDVSSLGLGYQLLEHYNQIGMEQWTQFVSNAGVVTCRVHWYTLYYQALSHVIIFPSRRQLTLWARLQSADW